VENWKPKDITIFYSNILYVDLFFLNREYRPFEILEIFDIPTIMHGMRINRIKEVCGDIRKLLNY